MVRAATMVQIAVRIALTMMLILEFCILLMNNDGLTICLSFLLFASITLRDAEQVALPRRQREVTIIRRLLLPELSAASLHEGATHVAV